MERIEHCGNSDDVYRERKKQVCEEAVLIFFLFLSHTNDLFVTLSDTSMVMILRGNRRQCQAQNSIEEKKNFAILLIVFRQHVPRKCLSLRTNTFIFHLFIDTLECFMRVLLFLPTNANLFFFSSSTTKNAPSGFFLVRSERFLEEKNCYITL